MLYYLMTAVPLMSVTARLTDVSGMQIAKQFDV